MLLILVRNPIFFIDYRTSDNSFLFNSSIELLNLQELSFVLQSEVQTVDPSLLSRY